MRIGLALGLAAWIVAAVLLWRTSVPSLRLGGLDPHQYFAPRLLARAHRYGNGEGLLWLLGELATLLALGVLAWRLPRTARSVALASIPSSRRYWAKSRRHSRRVALRIFSRSSCSLTALTTTCTCGWP